MILKLSFSADAGVNSPETEAYVEAQAIYYDKQYSEIMVRLSGNNTDLAAYAPLSVWESMSPELEKAFSAGHYFNLSGFPTFRSVSREYTLLHWKPSPVEKNGDIG